MLQGHDCHEKTANTGGTISGFGAGFGPIGTSTADLGIHGTAHAMGAA